MFVRQTVKFLAQASWLQAKERTHVLKAFLSSAYNLICASLLLSGMTALIRTKGQEQGKTTLAQYEDNLQRRLSESPECDATCQGCKCD